MAAAAIAQGQFDSIPVAVEAFRAPPLPPAPGPGRKKLTCAGNGEFLVVLDDPGRENEADLIVAAQNLSADQMAWMVRHSSGYICVPVKPSRADRLALPLMVAASQDPRGTAYTVSVDASHPSVTTGISAHDRALACRVLADPDASPASLRRPGHVLPLRAHPGGVRARPGHTEAAVELCRLAGLSEAAAICEIVDDGQEVSGRAVRLGAGMMTGEASIAFARKWGLKVCTIADLVDHVEKLEGKLQMNGSA